MCLTGIEPATYRLGGNRSILLSYRHNLCYCMQLTNPSKNGLYSALRNINKICMAVMMQTQLPTQQATQTYFCRLLPPD